MANLLTNFHKKILIGTSGWYYENWNKYFYPSDLKKSEWLSYYSLQLPSVEVNNTFYRLPSTHSIKTWLHHTPGKFIFSIKAWRVITHFKRLSNCHDELAAFFAIVNTFQMKCGPILFQVPPSFQINVDILTKFIEMLPTVYQYVFEFRNSTWHCKTTYELLQKHNIGWCIFEMGKFSSTQQITSDFIYIRLHGKENKYSGRYTTKQLLEWQYWIQLQNKDSYVYFDNTADKDDAIKNAMELNALFYPL